MIHRLYINYIYIIIILDSTWRNKYGQRWSKDRAGSVLDLMESILSGEVWCFFCLKRACSFTVGIYNDVAMMFNNAYLFNVIYVYNYIYNNAVYIPGSLVFLPWRALVRHACWNSKDSLANQFLISLFEMAHACTLGMYRWIQETIERFQHPNMSVGSKLFKAANIV